MPKGIVKLPAAALAFESFKLPVCTSGAQLLTDYEAEDSIRHLVNTFDWYFIPIVNPDGYVYSHENVSAHPCAVVPA